MQFSCVGGTLDPFDIQNGLTKSEVKYSIVKNPADKKSNNEKSDKTSAKISSPIPSISNLIMTPPPPSIGGDKTISFSVTDEVPLKDVLIELGRISGIDVDLDPAIDGGIILNATNRPFKEVIDRIATLGKLRYTYENNVLHFKRDTPFMKNYFVDYLIDGQLWSDVETNLSAVLDNAQTEDDTGATSSMSSNKSAGIISIFATETQHDQVAEYLSDVEESASAQVLIEAKIVEVVLNENYEAGISWTALADKIQGVGETSLGAGSAVTGIASKLSLFSGNLTSTVNALETFGTTRTIASPRLHAINNQKASLNFSDTLVYFKIDSNQDVTTTSGATPVNTSTITSTKQELDVGTQLDITPSINIKTGYVTMNIKPTLSVLSGTVEDPASGTIKNNVPEVNSRVIETTAKIRSGEVLVIGGLMKDATTNSDNGVPFLSKIPILGWFFRSTSKTTEITETVLFIKATIVKKGKNRASDIDRDFQQKFDSNRRRFFNQ